MARIFRLGARGLCPVLVSAAFVCALPATAAADRGGDNNKGDFWVDNVGQPPGPGHEMDPHLDCADINLWGDKMADSSGGYVIKGWPPSGSKQVAYSSTWNYDGDQGGSQVMDVIDVQTLIQNAVNNGDAPNNGQGFHFKIALSQDPHKYKTFWVNCPAPQPPQEQQPPPQEQQPPEQQQPPQQQTTPPTTATPAPATPPQQQTAPATSPGQQQVLGEQIRSKPKAKRKAKRHHRHHRKHKKVAHRKMRPKFTG